MYIKIFNPLGLHLLYLDISLVLSPDAFKYLVV